MILAISMSVCAHQPDRLNCEFSPGWKQIPRPPQASVLLAEFPNESGEPRWSSHPSGRLRACWYHAAGEVDTCERANEVELDLTSNTVYSTPWAICRAPAASTSR